VATDPGQAAFVSIQPPAPVGAKRNGRVIRLPTRTYELPGEETEIGNPLLSRTAASVAGSGRVSEWKGVLKQVKERPLLGYGFGTEERVFVDRWYYFQGGTAENSYLGLLLQLGGLGELMVCGIGLALLVMAVRTLCARTIARGEIGAEAGVLVAAACLMMIQSYIYSVGNIASGTVWVALFLLGANVLGGSTRADPS
jgi:O-antigen ligase